MSSMNDKLNEIMLMAGQFTFSEITKRQFSVNIKSSGLLSVLGLLRQKGFTHLSLITGIDRLNDEKFEVVYTLFCWESGETILVSTLVDRKTPVLPTIMEIWPVARFYERDVHEFFGIVFDGNPDLKPLILEKWSEIPPMRKDFDPHKYSKEHFPDRKYNADFLPEGGGEDE